MNGDGVTEAAPLQRLAAALGLGVSDGAASLPLVSDRAACDLAGRRPPGVKT